MYQNRSPMWALLTKHIYVLLLLINISSPILKKIKKLFVKVHFKYCLKHERDYYPIQKLEAKPSF